MSSLFQSQKIAAIWEVVVFVELYEVMFEHLNSIKEFSEITLAEFLADPFQKCRTDSRPWEMSLEYWRS